MGPVGYGIMKVRIHMTEELAHKYTALKVRLQELGSVAVAFSAGVDSTLLTYVAHAVLGDKMQAFTAQSDFVPARDAEAAAVFCQQHGITHTLVPFPILTVPHVQENPPDRCYYCKHALFARMQELAAAQGLQAVVDGSNLDDDGDFRPGHRALKELGIISPLHDAGMRKADIRTLSRELGLPTWDKPSFACLASRFPYGQPLTPEGLERVNTAEEFLLAHGFTQFRVRDHGKLARIEVPPQDIDRLLDHTLRTAITERLHELGYQYVTLDLQGYRTGAMNEVLGK